MVVAAPAPGRSQGDKPQAVPGFGTERAPGRVFDRIRVRRFIGRMGF